MNSFRMMDFSYVVLLTLLSRPLVISSEGQCHCPTAKPLSWRQSLLYCQSLNSSLASLGMERFRARTCLFGQTKYWTGRYKMESDWMEVAGCYEFDDFDDYTHYDKSAVDIDASSCFAFCHEFPYFGLKMDFIFAEEGCCLNDGTADQQLAIELAFSLENINNTCVCFTTLQRTSYFYDQCVPCSNARYLCGNSESIAVYRNASQNVKGIKGLRPYPKCVSISCEQSGKSWSYYENNCSDEHRVICNDSFSNEGKYESLAEASNYCFGKNSYLAVANAASDVCEVIETGNFWTQTLKDQVKLDTSFSDIYEVKKPVMCEYISFSPEIKYSFGKCDDVQGFACLINEYVIENCTLKDSEEKIAEEETNTVTIVVGCVVGVVIIVLIVAFVCYRLRFKKSKPVNDNICDERKSTSADNIITTNNVSSNEYNEIEPFQNPSYETIDVDDMPETADRKDDSNSSSEPSSKRQNDGGPDPSAAESNTTSINKNQYSFARRVYDHTQTPNENDDLKEDDYDHLNNDKRNPNKNSTDTNDDDYTRAPINRNTDDDYDKFDRNKVASVQPSFNYDHVHLREQHPDNEGPEDDSEDYDHLQRSPKIHNFVDSTYDHTHSVNNERPHPVSSNYDPPP